MATLSAAQSSCVVASPTPLDRALQRELAALAAIEADHRSVCRWLDEWSAPEDVKGHLACRLEARHQTQREAHGLRLAELHQKRMVLVMAETAKNSPDSYGGKLEQPGMFPLLVTDVLKQLKQRKIIARKATVDAITLAGHSGGYRVMAKILQNVNLPIHKVFLFDALYANESEYMNWIKQDTKNVFVNLYTDGGGTDKLTIEFMEQLKAGNIPFLKKEEADLTDVDIKNNRLIFVHSLHEHNYIINNPDNFQRFLMLTQ